jgi:hypothetical protein
MPTGEAGRPGGAAAETGEPRRARDAQADPAAQPTDEVAKTGAAEEKRAAEVIRRDLERIRGEPRALPQGEARVDVPGHAFTEMLAPSPAEVPASAAGGRFLTIPAGEAAAWLGAPLRTLPELELQSVEVGPADAIWRGLQGRPAVRLVYRDAAGKEITLIQQVGAAPAEEPDALVLPLGGRMYRWHDADHHLTLAGELPLDSLRALADRVR